MNNFTLNQLEYMKVKCKQCGKMQWVDSPLNEPLTGDYYCNECIEFGREEDEERYERKTGRYYKKWYKEWKEEKGNK